MVIAVCGPWGSGKTSFINFVEHFVNNGDGPRRPKILHFNPWWFSGHEDLVRRFFAVLEAFFAGRRIRVMKLCAQIAQFAEAVGDAPVLYASAGRTLAKLLRGKHRDVAELRSKLEQTLTTQDPVLVVIDDVDRLTCEEIRDLFQLIKAVAGLPNILYLVAMHRDLVAEALGKIQSAGGLGTSTK